MKLLVPVPEDAATPTLRAGGQTWTLREFKEDEPTPEYVAVSYAWGSGRAAHPFIAGDTVSDRAFEVLDTAARHAGSHALWLDALCVPSTEPARAMTLRRLGSIYGGAADVIVVLTRDSATLFEDAEHERPVRSETLAELDKEAWVSRFWTYQELAGSRQLKFVQPQSSFALSGTDFLNRVGEALWRAHREGALPGLENLIDVLASWRHQGPPFAYQVMAGMAARAAERPADRFNAVLGALDPDSAWEGALDVGAASERFMGVCENKGDLSFIYAASPRSSEPGRSWRPVPDELPPLLAWHTFGDGQGGKVFETHAVLNALHALEPGVIGPEAREYIEDWLAHSPAAAPTPSLASAVERALVAMGARTPCSALELTSGLFFPASDRRVDPTAVVLVASEVRWVHGAPGLLVEPLASGRYVCRDVGVFVGPVARHAGASFLLE
jgi:hypothetical protein